MADISVISSAERVYSSNSGATPSVFPLDLVFFHFI